MATIQTFPARPRLRATGFVAGGKVKVTNPASSTPLNNKRTAGLGMGTATLSRGRTRDIA
jgi:hypothetical protein